jgi:hypothetical protein
MAFLLEVSGLESFFQLMSNNSTSGEIELQLIYNLFSDCEEWQRWTPTVLTGRCSTCTARDEPSGIACSIRQVVPNKGRGRTKCIELNGTKHSSDSVAGPACHFDIDPVPACQFDAVANPDPDPTFHFDADPDPHPSYQIKAQNYKKVLN